MTLTLRRFNTSSSSSSFAIVEQRWAFLAALRIEDDPEVDSNVAVSEHPPPRFASSGGFGTSCMPNHVTVETPSRVFAAWQAFCRLHVIGYKQTAM